MPMMLYGGNRYDDVAHSVVILNVSKQEVSLEKGVVLDKLYRIASIPEEVERISSFDEVTEYLTTIYNHFELAQESSSLLLGPVYLPEKITANMKTINTTSCLLQFDTNKELTANRQSELYKVLSRYSSIFATSLKEVGKLNATPYEIKVKDGAVPVKVPTRMIPHADNEWFKCYIEQLLKLGLIEP